jgi:hypothetical protein
MYFVHPSHSPVVAWCCALAGTLGLATAMCGVASMAAIADMIGKNTVCIASQIITSNIAASRRPPLCTVPCHWWTKLSTVLLINASNWQHPHAPISYGYPTINMFSPALQCHAHVGHVRKLLSECHSVRHGRVSTGQSDRVHSCGQCNVVLQSQNCMCKNIICDHVINVSLVEMCALVSNVYKKFYV